MVIPVLIEQFAAVLMGMISTIISSQLGPTAISAIGSVSVLTMLIISVFSSLSTGGTVVVAQYIGRGDRAKANKAAVTALLSTALLLLILITSVLVFRRQLIALLFGSAGPAVTELALEYLTVICFYFFPFGMTSMSLALLRGSGDMKTPMKVSLVTNLVSAAISYPLIYGFAPPSAGAGLGVRGAALGMAIAQTVGLVLVIRILLFGHRSIDLRYEKLYLITPQILKNILFFGLPAGAEQLMFNGGKLLVQTFIMGLGTAAIAANSIVNSISGLVTVGGNALAILATTLVGQLLGAGQKNKARKWNIYITTFACLINLGIALICLPLIGFIVRAYTTDPATVSLARNLVLSYLLVMPFVHAPSFAIPSGLRGAGDVRFTMIIAVISMWIMRVGASYVLAVVFKLGVFGIWIGMYLDWVVRALFYVPRTLGRKWLEQKSLS